MANNNSHLVSVIIPCYKQAHFLGEAIESVMKQTYPHFEIIVVDDGSPDNTSEVAARYPHVRCIRQKNQGLARARNAGIRESRGDVIVFLDSDDRLLPDALEIGINCLESYPECGFVSGICNIIAADGSPLPPYDSQLIAGENLYLSLLRNCPIFAPATVTYRRSIIEYVGGFNPSNGPAADYDLYYRIAREFPIHSHGKAVAEYRKHGESMTTDSSKMLKANVTALRSQWKYVKKSKQHREAYKTGIKFWQAMYGETVAHEARMHVRGREFKPAMKKGMVLLRYYPEAMMKHIGRKFYRVLLRAKGLIIVD